MEHLNKCFVAFGVAVLMTMAVEGAFAAGEHGGHQHEGSHAEEVSGTSLTGEVVDLVCYSSHPEDGIGPKHAECAQQCIKSGLPAAILSNGKLYVALGAGHDSVNAMLAQYGGRNVTVHGTVVERDGLRMVQVESVEPAS